MRLDITISKIEERLLILMARKWVRASENITVTFTLQSWQTSCQPSILQFQWATTSYHKITPKLPFKYSLRFPLQRHCWTTGIQSCRVFIQIMGGMSCRQGVAKQGLLDFDFRGSCKIVGLMGCFLGAVRVAGVDKQLSNSRIHLTSHFSAFEVSSQRGRVHV